MGGGACRGDRPAGDLLGRQIRGGAHDQADLGPRRLADHAGDTEVGDLDHAVAADQQIARLNVAMHDTSPVRCPKGQRRLRDHVQDPLGVQPSLPRQHRQQGRTLDQLHHQIRGGIGLPGLAVVEDAGDAGMRQRGGAARLGPEPVEERPVFRELAAEELHGHRPPENLVRRPPHLAHAAAGEPVDQTVPTRQKRLRGERGRHRCVPIQCVTSTRSSSVARLAA